MTSMQNYYLLLQMVVFFLILSLWHIKVSASAPEAPMSKPDCATHCGDVSIPYPFGIGPNKHCYFDEWFEMSCNKSFESEIERAILIKTNVEVLNISVQDGTLLVNSPVTFSCHRSDDRQPPDLTGSPFVYSARHTRFTAVSCGLFAIVNSDEHIVGGCWSICEGTDLSYDNCEIGTNCCQTNIPPHLSKITTSIEHYDGIEDRDNCKNTYAFLVDKEWLLKSTIASNFSTIADMENVPVMLEWSLIYDNVSIPLFKKFVVGKNKSRASDDPTPCCNILDATPAYNRSRILCSCPPGFEGNPYLGDACYDIDECADEKSCGVGDSYCVNYGGSYQCYPHIVVGKSKVTPTLLIGIGVGVGLLFLLIGAWWVHENLKKRKKMKRKEMFFKRNGGLLLEQQLSSGEVNVDRIKLFKSKELEKSTDNFNTDRILGHGGQGTVYKGMLSDGRIVAVKRSKIVDESQVSDFINEVVILSQINHRNVVQVFGCCLETDVPILVYEFIPNGTLAQFIHESQEFPLTWEIRLRIATEVAGALSYLHCAASFPIFHRDIKSTNILLDAKYRAKVADFGTSRSVAIDQTHLTTHVHGTYGYLDPEYSQSGQFTDKSDVYSFGVVLVELLTGQKPISFIRSQEEGKTLATYFLISMDLDRLFEILDPQVINGGSREDIIIVANVARRCLSLSGRKRPSMREVAAELEGVQIRGKTSNAGGEQKSEEVEYVWTESIEPWDDLVSNSTVTEPVFNGAPPPVHEIPLLPFRSG